MLMGWAHGAESGGVRAGEGIGVNRPVPPCREQGRAAERHGRARPTGAKGRAGGVAGFFGFSFFF
jgi:hypothetical protein